MGAPATASPEGPVLRLGVVSDLHLVAGSAAPTVWNNPVWRGEAAGLLAEALAWLAPRADAVALLGDLADAPDQAAYARLADLLAAVDLPIYAVLGNHDLPRDFGPAAAADLAAAGVRLLDFGGPARVGPFTVLSTPLRRVGSSFAQDVPTCWAVPEDDAVRPPAGSAPLIWAGHLPAISLRSKVEACRWLYAGDLVNRLAVLEALRAYPGPVLALGGHLHVRAHAIDDNVLQLVSGALAEAPREAAVVTLAPSGPGGWTVTRRCRSFAHGHERELGAALDRQQTTFVWRRGRWDEHRPAPAAPAGPKPNLDPR
ncbi:MAG: metallophosphoesterase [Bifidobacteriaceae bacterium]|jgi:hypothetical protein|nr:metallophosphoesterase [Bifidobacteriaceae bacterium]